MKLRPLGNVRNWAISQVSPKAQRTDQEVNNIRARIAIGYRSGDKGRRDVLRQKVLPYNFLEPWVCENIPGAVPHVTVPLRRIGFHQFENQVAGSRVEEGRPLNDSRPLGNLVV